LIDGNKKRLFKWYDAFYGLDALLISVALLYIFVEPILILNTTSLIDKAVLILSLVAVVTALFSMAIPSVRANIVAKNFKRLEESVETEKKPLLKSLIKLKVKNLKFELEPIYEMHKDMFTKEKLLERLYE
jgi:hypothetical protein